MAGVVDRARTFPPGFMWGVGTSGYQTEGGDPHSDWAAWETAGRVAEPLGPAIASWARAEDDLGLASGMGLNAVRIGLEWSRIEPNCGEYDEVAIARYRRMLEHARSIGLTPIVTLNHFTLPAWLADRGGWTNPRAVTWFANYANHVGKALGDLVTYWLTLNEPNSLATCAYGLGLFPPGRRNPRAMGVALEAMRRAHGAAYSILHGLNHQAKVSFSLFEFYQRPGSRRLGHLDLGRWTGGEGFLAKLVRVRQVDFIALDYYYGHGWLDLGKTMKPNQWVVHPEGLYEVVMRRFRRHNLPILIAENGLSMPPTGPREDGWTREAYLVHHLEALHRAVSEGASVLGYMHWTLADSYEWGTYERRFGLYTVDRADPALPRHATPAVEVYGGIARANGLSTELLKRFGVG